jgi:sulfotransferase family protein
MLPAVIVSDIDEAVKISPNINFVVTGPGRTGSQLLLTALRQHSQIHCLEEIFLPIYYRESYLPAGKSKARDILDTWPCPAGKTIFGFSALYPELFRSEYTPDLIEELIARRFRIIHVSRNNLLRRFLSHKIARKTDVWGDATGENPTTLKVHIAPWELLLDIRRVLKRAESVKMRLGHLPFLDISYEALCDDFSGTFSRVCDFLGVSYEDLKPKTFKQESRSLRESIANYDYLKLVFTFSKYSRFFDD